MLRKFFRSFLILLQLCILCVFIGCGAFLWRLHHAPINVDGLIPYVVHAFAVPESKADINIKSAQLIWRNASRPVDLVVKDFRVTDKNGLLISSVPELSVSLSFRALLRGIIAPKSLAVYRPALRLYIGKDGSVRSSKNQTASAETAADKTETDTVLPVDTLLSYLEKETYLSTFSLVNAKIRITDEYHNIEWIIPSADLTYSNKNGTNTLSGAMTLKTKTIPLTMKVNGGWNKDKTALKLSFRFNNIDASRLSVADKYPFLKQLTTPINFETTTHLETNALLKAKKISALRDAIQKIEFSLKGSKGRLLLPDPIIADYDLNSFSVNGAIYDKGDKFDISEFNVRLTNGNASGNISVQGIGKALDTKSWETVSAVMKARVSDIPVNKLPDYWPATIEPDIHSWIKENMRDGIIEDGNFNLHFVGMKDEASIDCDKVFGIVNVKNTNITYMDGMPEVENVSGNVSLSRDAVNINISSGSSFDVSVKKGLVSFYNLEQKLSDGKVVLDLEGSVANALKILDQPPLDITKDLGIDPQKTAGDVKGNLRLDFPIGDAFVSSDQLKIGANATVTNGEFQNLVADFGLQDVALSLDVEGPEVNIKGTGNFLSSPAEFALTQSFDTNKADKTKINFKTVLTDSARKSFDFDTGFLVPPSLTGLIPVSLTLTENRNAATAVDISFNLDAAAINLSQAGWEKPAGKKGDAELKLALKNNELTAIPFFALRDSLGNLAEGNIKFNKGASLKEIRLTSLKTGRTNANARIRFDNDLIKIDVAGTSMDLGKIIDSPTALDETDETNENDENEKSLIINAAVDKIWLSEKGFTTNNALYAKRKKSVWEEIKTIGLVGEQSIPLNFTLLPSENGKNYKYVLTSEDAGGSLAALDYISSIRGGRLRTEGTYTPGEGSKGTLHVSEFRMVEMPVLSRILMLTSFTGIVDLFKGEGLVFDKAEIPYTINDAAVSIQDGLVAGPSLGVTLNGKYYRRTGYLNLRGSLVPFYTINSFLGKIPVIGKIFAGEKGGGLIAPTYTVKGELPSPDVSVNAFSALAPGAVRELVDKATASDEDLSKNNSPLPLGQELKKQPEKTPSKALSAPAKDKKTTPKKLEGKVLTDSLQYGF